MQLGQLRARLSKLTDLNAQLLAVDPHDGFSAKFLLKDSGLTTDDLNFPLLLDPALTVSAEYGVPFQMRIHSEWSNRPATFVIDKDGIIRFAHYATTFNDRPKVETIEGELRKLKK
jgi:peroxiredoxin